MSESIWEALELLIWTNLLLVFFVGTLVFGVRGRRFLQRANESAKRQAARVMALDAVLGIMILGFPATLILIGLIAVFRLEHLMNAVILPVPPGAYPFVMRFSQYLTLTALAGASAAFCIPYILENDLSRETWRSFRWLRRLSIWLRAIRINVRRQTWCVEARKRIVAGRSFVQKYDRRLW